MHEMCNLLSVDYFENVQWMVHACKCLDEVGSASTWFFYVNIVGKLISFGANGVNVF
jgi:hypothetical protein